MRETSCTLGSLAHLQRNNRVDAAAFSSRRQIIRICSGDTYLEISFLIVGAGASTKNNRSDAAASIAAKRSTMNYFGDVPEYCSSDQLLMTHPQRKDRTDTAVLVTR